jgi:putative ABC transport system substrate-binding protein
MHRREFITLAGSAAAAWPLAARAQAPEKMRLVGVLMGVAADDPEGQARIGAFLRGMQKAGWELGRNMQVEYRWAAGDPVRVRTYAAELSKLAPDVILANGNFSVTPLLQVTSTIPVVFVNVSDPVGTGLVASLTRPGGNATGFTTDEYSISAKWLELLKQMAPQIRRVAVMRDPGIDSGIGQLAAIQSVAPMVGVELNAVSLREAGEIERAISNFAQGPNDGLIVVAGAGANVHRDLIIALAARYRLPAIYPFRFFVTAGGLMSYGPNSVDPFLRAAGYVDRILRGEKPADLPVQNPTRHETVINLKTAKVLGLTVPPSLLASADEVIE